MQKDFGRGFTLIELLIFAGIFSIVMIAFITILVAITSIQTKQLSVSEVTEQSQFLLQTIQYNTEQSSLIEMPQDTATTTLKLRMPNSSQDPTYIYSSGNTLYIKQTDVGTPQPLNSSKVNVTGVSFSRHSNGASHDTVSVVFTVAYNTSNLKQQFVQAFQFAIARVSAATFDSNVIPTSTATYKLGVSGQIWSTVNDILNFAVSCGGGSNCAGVNLGAGVSPTQVLQVGGGDIYISTAGQGVVFKSPGGTCFKLTMTNGGQLATSSFTCT